MNKTLREIGIDCLGVDPFLKKIGLDGDMTVDELQKLLRFGGRVGEAARRIPEDARKAGWVACIEAITDSTFFEFKA